MAAVSVKRSIENIREGSSCNEAICRFELCRIQSEADSIALCPPLPAMFYSSLQAELFAERLHICLRQLKGFLSTGKYEGEINKGILVEQVRILLSNSTIM